MRTTSSPCFESLEHRLCLSTTPIAPHVTRTGTLLVTGTSGPDVIGIDRKGDFIRVIQEDPTGQIALLVSTFSTAKVKRLLAQGNSGNDRIGVRSSFTKPVTLTGNSGSDTLAGPQGATLIGGAGNDKLICDVPNLGSLPPSALYAPGEGGEVGTPKKRGVLNGGDGDDILVTWVYDSVTGSRGNDFCYVDLAGTAISEPDGLEDLFEGRALSVEEFAML